MSKSSLATYLLAFTLTVFFAGDVCSDIRDTSKQKPEPDSEKFHETTQWKVQPSFKYDVLCFLNILTGDPFYTHYYPDEYAHFEPLLNPPVREALASLKQKVKDENGRIISALLTLYFSATDDENLGEMISTLNDSKAMRENLRKTTYYDEEGWSLYESIRPQLKTIFKHLEDIQFYDYWSSNIRTRVDKTIADIEPQLTTYNVIHEVEQRLGHPLGSDLITVYMLYYSQPHGIRITGTRFLTDIAWPFETALRVAIHEMIHPPYDLAGDQELRSALEQLKKDDFLMDKVENHNPSFGYNSFEGFVEEDVVQALDQVISLRLGVARDPKRRWKHNDDGMHVFAVALYGTMKKYEFENKDIMLRDFLVQQIQQGDLKPGRIEALYNQFYAE